VLVGRPVEVRVLSTAPSIFDPKVFSILLK
jgi:hypothetical protein